MTTGNALFDSYLEDLHLNIFANVMFLKASHWSNISTQFMLSFPHCLIINHHSGILLGNITVPARISNQAGGGGQKCSIARHLTDWRDRRETGSGMHSA